MYKLDAIQQDYILHCPNEAHDAVRRFMGFEEKLSVTRQLVRIHG